jgi:hypothetical protein
MLSATQARLLFSATVNQGDGRPPANGAERSSSCARSFSMMLATYCESSGASDV